MPLCLIGLGSNLGDRSRALDDAVARLGRHPQVRLLSTSPWLETRAAGGPPGQPAYLNGVVLAETSLGPEALLGVLQGIEQELGRRRHQRWAPRMIDLDLLLYDQVVRSGPPPVLPHPRMAWRRFVLEPAAAVAGDMLHPEIGWTVRQLLDHLNATPYYAAICGVVGSGKTLLARQVAQRSGARLLAASSTLEHALEWLEEVSGLLAADRPEWRSSGLATVSDFWLEASLAAARLFLPAAEWEAYRARWEASRARVVRPRLIVLLETPAEEVLRRPESRSGSPAWTAEQVERTAAAILGAALRPDQGPLLRLPGADPAAAVAEVLAALEAMRP
jgi:2-amino-4-hydroxy-6-hydroxymethyldihydropteridine diphosphokinase